MSLALALALGPKSLLTSLPLAEKMWHDSGMVVNVLSLSRHFCYVNLISFHDMKLKQDEDYSITKKKLFHNAISSYRRMTRNDRRQNTCNATISTTVETPSSCVTRATLIAAR